MVAIDVVISGNHFFSNAASDEDYKMQDESD
jgi:hypothetical protein